MNDTDPFPFCHLCATWHAPGEHLSEQWSTYYGRKGRIDFWYGWICGVATGIAFSLIVFLTVEAWRAVG
jgi:hypothetical protein